MIIPVGFVSYSVFFISFQGKPVNREVLLAGLQAGDVVEFGPGFGQTGRVTEVDAVDGIYTILTESDTAQVSLGSLRHMVVDDPPEATSAASRPRTRGRKRVSFSGYFCL